MNNPLKSIVIEGDLGLGEIQYKLCPDYLNVHQGIWEIAVYNIATTQIGVLDKDYIFQISCNFVQGHMFNKGQLSKVNVTLCQFMCEKNTPKFVEINNPPLWFVVNNSTSDYLSLTIKEWPRPVIKIKSKRVIVAVTILLRRLM